MTSLGRTNRSANLPHTTCRHCAETLVLVEAVGWLDPQAGHCYDLCPRDPYGNHEVDRPTKRGST